MSSNSNAESISTKTYKRRPLSNKTGSGLFLFSPDAKIIDKSVKYAIMELAAEQTIRNQKRQWSLDLSRLRLLLS